MSSKIKLTNENGKQLVIDSGSITEDKQIQASDIAYTRTTVADMIDIVAPSDNDVCVVTDKNQGGTFVYDSSKITDDNQGTNFKGWIRQYSGAVNVKWFGAKGDGVVYTNAVILESIFNSFSSVYVPKDTYYIEDEIRLSTFFDNISIVGDNVTFIIKTGLYDAFRFGHKVVDVNGFDTIVSPENYGLTMSGITMKAETEDSTSVVVSVYAYKDVNISNCTFSGFKVEGLYIGTGCEDVNIDNCYFVETASTSESKGLSIIQYPADYQSYGIDNQTWEYITRPTTHIKNVNIVNCTFERTRIQVSNVQNINVSNCSFKNSKVRGINFSPWVYSFQVSNSNFTLASGASTCINIGHACKNGIISSNLFTDSNDSSRTLNLYYGVENVLIENNYFRGNSTRDIVIANMVKSIDILSNKFFSGVTIGECIRIQSIDFYSADKDIANTATDDKMNEGITILNNSFKGRNGKYIYILPETNSNATPKPLPIYNINISNNNFFYDDLYFPSNGDAFVTLNLLANLDTFTYINNGIIKNRGITIPSGKLDLYIVNPTALLNKTITSKIAKYKVTIDSGSISTELLGGDIEVTNYTAIISSTVVRIGGRYRGTVPKVSSIQYAADSQISRHIHKVGTTNDGDYTFKDQSDADIDLNTVTGLVFYVTLDTIYSV